MYARTFIISTALGFLLVVGTEGPTVLPCESSDAPPAADSAAQEDIVRRMMLEDLV